jgi:hypothetical protein
MFCHQCHNAFVPVKDKVMAEQLRQPGDDAHNYNKYYGQFSFQQFQNAINISSNISGFNDIFLPPVLAEG